MRLSTPIYLASFAAEKAGFTQLADRTYRMAAETLGDPDAWFRLGRIAFQKGAWAEGAACFGKSAEIRPDHAESHFKKGFCLLKASKWVEAEAAIAKAISLDPSQTQWSTQHRQVLEKVGTLAGPQPDVFTTIKDISGFTGLLKSLTFAEEFERFDQLIELVQATYGQGLSSTDTRLALMEIERFGAADLHDRAAAVAAAMPAESFRADHGRAWIAFAEGRYGDCVNQLEGRGPELIRDASAARLFARAARIAGWNRVGFDAIRETLAAGGDSITWKEASLLVNDRDGLAELLKLWNGYRNGRKMTPNLLKVAGHIASAAFHAGNRLEAERIQRENILTFGKKKITRPPETFDPANHPEYANLPLMCVPLKGCSFQAIENVTARYFRALLALSALLDSAGIRHTAIRRTVAILTAKRVNPGLDDAVDIGVIGLSDLGTIASLLDQSPSFLATEGPCGEAHMLPFSHANGIAVRIFLMREEGSCWIHGCKGMEWTHRIQEIRRTEVRGGTVSLPVEPSAHLAEFTAGAAGTLDETRCLSGALNSKVVDREAFIFHLRSHLIHLMVAGDEDGALRCVHKLAEVGDHQLVREFHGSYPNYVDANLPQLLKDKPQVMLYLSGLEDVAYQGNMWIPVLEKLDARCAIAIRERRIATGLLPTSMPVYYFDSMRDLEFMEECGVRTILYPANTAKNTNSLRFFKINHFFINHGESDKVVNQSKFLMAYDKLLVAGPLAERRLREAGLPVREEQVVHVGRPQTELLLKRVDSPSTAPRRILFAPTWEGFVEEANYASINEYGLRLLTTLAADKRFQVAFKPHPYTGKAKPNAEGVYLKRMTEAASKAGVQIIQAGKPIFDCMNDSDLMITDVSSVLNDYLYTLKPMILTNPRGEDHDSLRANFPSSAATYVLDQGEDVVKLIDRIAADDHMFAKRREVCADSLGEFPEGSLARFNRVVNESLAILE